MSKRTKTARRESEDGLQIPKIKKQVKKNADRFTVDPEAKKIVKTCWKCRGTKKTGEDLWQNIVGNHEEGNRRRR